MQRRCNSVALVVCHLCQCRDPKWHPHVGANAIAIPPVWEREWRAAREQPNSPELGRTGWNWAGGGCVGRQACQPREGVGLGGSILDLTGARQ